MREQDAVEKMTDLMNSVETATKYSNVASCIPAMFLLSLVAVLEADLITIAINYYNYATLNTFLYNLPVTSIFSISSGIAVVLGWLPIGYIMYRMVKRALDRPMDQSWKTDLKGGVLGILKIIEQTNWEEKLTELKRAKLIFLFFSVMELLLSWVLTVILLYFASIPLLGAFSIYPNTYAILILSVVIVAGLGDTYIKGRYRQLWNMDNLISELRWFYLEFEGEGL